MKKVLDLSPLTDEELIRMDGRLHQHRMTVRADWGRATALIEKITAERARRARINAAAGSVPPVTGRVSAYG